MTISDRLQELWNGLLDLTEQLVLPDWANLITLLPWAVLLFIAGPILSLLVLGWFIYVVRRPRSGTPYVEPAPVRAPLGEDGLPVFPRGEPFCFRDGLLYPTGSTRCDTCGDELSVHCPKCNVTRRAAISTCGNCGLVLRIEPRAAALRPAGPPPGGAAAA